MSPAPHTPVLLAEVVAALAPRAGSIIVDGTFGAGGYSRAILDAAPCTVYGIDRDPDQRRDHRLRRRLDVHRRIEARPAHGALGDDPALVRDDHGAQARQCSSIADRNLGARDRRRGYGWTAQRRERDQRDEQEASEPTLRRGHGSFVARMPAGSRLPILALQS